LLHGGSIAFANHAGLSGQFNATGRATAMPNKLINKPVSVGMPQEYIDALKKELPARGYKSLSEFIRDLIEANSEACAKIKAKADRANARTGRTQGRKL
jgi:Arc/MetJ-type ribon-helix-helix transcriptional regulator